MPEKLFVEADFRTAGQDSYTQPPAQDQKLFEVLENILPVTQGPFFKRWGYSLFNTLSNVPRRLYEYQSDLTGTRRIIVSSKDRVRSLTEAGVDDNTNILTPDVSAIDPRITVSRDFAYIADGIQADALKWDGSASGGTTKWGIDQSGTATSETQSAGAGANSGTGQAWINPGNITASNDTRATVALTLAQNSQILEATTFGFTIPSGATILGIEAKVERSDNNTLAGRDIANLLVKLIKGGTVVGLERRWPPEINDPVNSGWPTTDTVRVYGSPTDLWGENWLPSDVNATNFGLAFQAVHQINAGTETAQIDHMEIVIYFRDAITVGTPVGGSITLDIGRKYFFVWKNSTTGNISDLSQVSASTGPITAQDVPLTDIAASGDSQVDRKLVLATADGGDETRLYFLADLPNATTTLTDDVPEETLLLRNVYLNVNLFGEERGVSGNLPPPRLTIPIKHRARIWGAGNPDNLQLLYYSKNISELVTDTGVIAGRYEECWPAENFLDVSGGAESITALFSDGQTLYVASERQIRRILGDPPNLLIPEVVFNNVGVVNPEVWKPVFIEGTPAGTIFLTPDRRVIFTDFNTYSDIGWPVQDVLDTLNASEIQKSRAEFFSDGPHEWYILAIPTGANTEPDTLLVYHLKAKRWYVWKPTDKVTAMLHNVQADGTVQFLFGADTSKTYKFSSSDTQDRVNDTPVSFTSTITTTWRHYGVPATLKLLNKLKIFSSDSGLQVTVDGASTQAEFGTPSNVVTDSTLTAGPLGDLELFLAGRTTKDKYYRYKFTSTANLDQNSPALNYIEIYYVPFHVF